VHRESRRVLGWGRGTENIEAQIMAEDSGE
jgi:hypothetical protein